MLNIPYYQTIPELGIKGRMNTPEEFEKIGLPKEMYGWCVMDIGCNMGAFLLEANKRGATCLNGIEPDQGWRLLAHGIAEEMGTTFLIDKKIDLENYAGHRFDLVLLLSITHVAEGVTGQELVDKAYELTKEGGLFILEVNDRLQKEYLRIPKQAKVFGKNKDNRTVYHIWK